MATAKKKNTDGTAEQKIIAAARKLFTRKGYDAVKTRDIAAEAGINLALLNYYFRSKEKLFEIIMQENMQQFFMSIMILINDEQTSMKEKINLLVNKYIDMLTQTPELPLFVMMHMRNNPERMGLQGKFRESYLMKQVQQASKKGEIAPISPPNFMMNLVGLTIFPFIGKPMVKAAGGIDDKEFYRLMEERRKLIPQWIEAILKAK